MVEEQTLKQIFEAEIRPALAPLEAKRQKAHARVRIAYGVVGVLAAAFVVLAIVFGWPWFIWLIGAFILLALGGIAHAVLSSGFFRELRAAVMGPITRHLELDYDRQGAFDFSGFYAARVVGNHNSRSFQDSLRGRYRGIGYSMVEAHLQRRMRTGKRTQTITVFRGLLFRIEVPVAFSGITLISRDRGGIGNALSGLGKRFAGLRRHDTGLPEFEEIFEVYTDSPAEVPQLINRAVADSLVALAEAHDGETLTAAYIDGEFLMALPMAGGFLEFGRLNRPVEAVEDELETIVDDLAIARRIIDYLMGEGDGRLRR